MKEMAILLTVLLIGGVATKSWSTSDDDEGRNRREC